MWLQLIEGFTCAIAGSGIGYYVAVQQLRPFIDRLRTLPEKVKEDDKVKSFIDYLDRIPEKSEQKIRRESEVLSKQLKEGLCQLR